MYQAFGGSFVADTKVQNQLKIFSCGVAVGKGLSQSEQSAMPVRFCNGP